MTLPYLISLSGYNTTSRVKQGRRDGRGSPFESEARERTASQINRTFVRAMTEPEAACHAG